MFNKYDRNRSGTLDKSELHTVFNECLRRMGVPVRLEADESEALLYEIDKNSDGSISQQELLSCLRSLACNERFSKKTQ